MHGLLLNYFSVHLLSWLCTQHIGMGQQQQIVINKIEHTYGRVKEILQNN